METTMKIEQMVKKEPEECNDIKYEALWRTEDLREEGSILKSDVKLEEDEEVNEERNDDVIAEFEGVWNYHKLKEERREFEYAEEEKLEEVEEEGLKPPLLVLVHPNGGDDKNEKREERDIFDEVGVISHARDFGAEQARQSRAEIETSSRTYSSLFSSQEYKQIPSSSDPSCARFVKKILIRSSKNITAQKRNPDFDHCSGDDKKSLPVQKHINVERRRYQCTDGDAFFSKSSNLKVHKRLHTGEHPYRCDECDASFTESVTLEWW